MEDKIVQAAVVAILTPIYEMVGFDLRQAQVIAAVRCSAMVALRKTLAPTSGWVERGGRQFLQKIDVGAIGAVSPARLAGSKVQPSPSARADGDAPADVETATTVSTDIPGRAKLAPCSLALNRMRTVKPRTILVKFPVVLSGGISTNSEPEAGAIASTYPQKGRPG
jgi:hypothetical protein